MQPAVPISVPPSGEKPRTSSHCNWPDHVTTFHKAIVAFVYCVSFAAVVDRYAQVMEESTSDKEEVEINIFGVSET